MDVVDGDAQLAEWLEEKLLVSLSVSNEQATNENIVLAAKDVNGQIMGGLVGSTSYGWLLVKILWVSSERRGSGIGRSLMQQELPQSAGDEII